MSIPPADQLDRNCHEWRDPFHDVPGELMLGAAGAIAIMVIFGVGVFVLVST